MSSSSGGGDGGSSSRPTAGKHPIYRGIRCRSGKWVSEIREPKKTSRIWLGTYPTPEMAAAAFDVAVLALKGSEAALNFPDRVKSYPVAASPSPPDIRTAAAAAAWLMRTDRPSGCGPEAGVGTSQISPGPQPGGNEGSGGSAGGGGVAPPQPGGNEGSGSSAGGGVVVPPQCGGDEFIDEEELFGMPNLLVDMAGGMLVSPPRIKSPPSDDDYSPGSSDGDVLWSYKLSESL